jgi:hypothetical protein
MYQALADYLPLVPALSNPAAAQHRRAVQSFPKHSSFLFLQWMLAEKSHLSAAEAADFFGHESEEAELIGAALQKDRESFEKRYQHLFGPRENAAELISADEATLRKADGKAVLYAWLRNELLPVGAPKDQPDLRPAQAEPLLPRLRTLLGGKKN